MEPIEIRALEEMEDLSMGKYLFFVSAQDACRAKRTLAKILLVVFGSVSTRGPTGRHPHGRPLGFKTIIKPSKEAVKLVNELKGGLILH